MKTLITIALIAASPATGFERMARADCQNAWIAATETLEFGVMSEGQSAIDAMRAEALLVEATLTVDGWCRLTGDAPGLEGANFGTFDWQAEGIGRFIKDGAPPLALRVRLTNVGDEGSARPLDLTASLRQIPGEGILLIEEFGLSDGHGDWIALTAVLNSAFFDTRSSTLSSLGGITLQRLAARVTVDPDRTARTNDPGITLADDLHEVVVTILDGLDDQQLSQTGNAALSALLDDLPEAEGQLNIEAASGTGLGWMQIAGAVGFNPDATNAEILNFALYGVTVDATWTPIE